MEIESDTGLVGLGEMGGGGESAIATVLALKPSLVGRDPARLEEMRFVLANPTASLYNNRTQVVAALEFACLDLLGQAWGVPVCDILGGRVRDRVPVRVVPCSSATRTRRAVERSAPSSRSSSTRTIAEKEHTGFDRTNSRGGIFPPDYDLECYRALAAAAARRSDPVRSERGLVDRTSHPLRTRDRRSEQRLPRRSGVWARRNAARARERLAFRSPRNTVVVNFEQLSANVLHACGRRHPSRHDVLGRHPACVKAAGVCETFQLGVAVHSSGELGIQLATMLHLGAVVPNLSFAADAHYHHLVDDIIEGGSGSYENGTMRVPDAPGLGVRLDREKLATYAELYRELGNYADDQDPARPGWAPLVPNDRWADPGDDLEPFVD